MVSNRDVGLQFRREVLLYMLLRGLRVADPMDGASRLTDLVGNPDAFTDIAGIEPWVIDVRSYTHEAALSTALNEVTAAARAAGSEWPCAILRRRGRTLDEAYAVVPLDTMLRIFKGEAPSPEPRTSAASTDDRDPSIRDR